MLTASMAQGAVHTRGGQGRLQLLEHTTRLPFWQRKLLHACLSGKVHYHTFDLLATKITTQLFVWRGAGRCSRAFRPRPATRSSCTARLAGYPPPAPRPLHPATRILLHVCLFWQRKLLHVCPSGNKNTTQLLTTNNKTGRPHGPRARRVRRGIHLPPLTINGSSPCITGASPWRGNPRRLPQHLPQQ